MKTFISKLLLCAIFLAPGVQVFGQEEPVDRLSVAFSDPSRPGLLKASLITGSISVTGYEGKEVVIEARTRTKRYSKESRSRSGDLKRIPIRSTGLTVEEQHNEMEVGAASHMRAIDLDIKMPKKTSLKLSTVNSGDIVVERVEGEIELNNVNGSIKAHNISGSVVANTTNGKVEVTFDKVEPDKPMSFVSFNGRVDVTLPANVKADVKMKSEQGEIYSDFDIKIEQKPKLIKEDTRKRGGKYKVRIENAIYGTINGGGPQYYFSTYNGSIYIRKSE
ncbi:DUF4097 domain-containing protein [candidate division KSB1 bacterium]|nr:DUF4097 domain-containing protein [candidate division KSB1 bacterium]NIR68608.1 DUF4097 domain-containing protein [candidate division KSB1 bacterium]NIS24112.1 DUF4097 domain-containing protein [candidate division KSB1 bacterium]NIT71029.1 DUF4097 domain-containing protein [candidate division KSB1 bacterium]NIU24731.1 DUF4097 domain-containing protein [candidate division KSB1 bacterium]